MKQCPICGSKFAGTESFCPHDGAHLLEAEQPAQLLGQTLYDLFKLETLLYKDAMGERYSGRLTGDGTSVKVTIFNQAYTPETDRVNALVTAKTLLNEPMPSSVATTHGWDFNLAPGYLVESLPKGPSLRVLLDERGKLDWRTAVKLTCSLARRLEWMDNLGVAHRILQPEVISITHIKRGEVHLGEWALGALSYQDNPLEAVGKGKLVPAAAYMAPELIDGSSKPDRRSQIYTLGLLLYEMLTGKSPFKSPKTEETLKRQRRERPVKLSISYEGEPLPGALDDLFEVMTAKLPEQRFQALGALVNALSSTLDDDTSAADFPEIVRDPDARSIVLKKPTAPTSGTEAPDTGSKDRKQTLLFISAEDVKKAQAEANAEAPGVDDANKSTVQMDSRVLEDDIARAKALSNSGESSTTDQPAPKEATSEPLKKKKKKKKKSKETIRLTKDDLPDYSNNVGINDPESEVEVEADDPTETPKKSTIVIAQDLIEDAKQEDPKDSIIVDEALTKEEKTAKSPSKGISGSSGTSSTSDDTKKSDTKPETKDKAEESISIQDALDAARDDRSEQPKKQEDKTSKPAPSEHEAATTNLAESSSVQHNEFAPVDDDQWFNSNSEKTWDNEIFMEHEERTNKKFKTYLIVALVLFLLALIVGAVLIATAPEEEEEASLIPDAPPSVEYARLH